MFYGFAPESVNVGLVRVWGVGAKRIGWHATIEFFEFGGISVDASFVPSLRQKNRPKNKRL
jgi:hypothetical protein